MDINNLTLGEVATIEDLSGQGIAAFANDEKPKGLALAAFAFVIKRRTAPEFLWNDALGLTFDEAHEILGIGGDDEDGPAGDDAKSPNEPAEQPAPKEKRSRS